MGCGLQESLKVNLVLGKTNKLVINRIFSANWYENLNQQYVLGNSI